MIHAFQPPFYVLFLLSFLLASPFSKGAEPGEKSPHFFALCMDMQDEKKRTIEQQNEMLAELGYDGVAHLWLDGLPERVASAKRHGLKVTQVYFQVNLAADPPFDPKLSEVLPCLQGEGTQLALLMTGGRASDPALDDKAVEIIRRIIDIAKPLGVKVVLYPHAGNWLEKVSDCVRIAKRFPDKEVGVMFNLCHWVILDRSENLESVLKSAAPYLSAVTINGTDTPEEIQKKNGRRFLSLEEGSFDIAEFLALLEKLGYDGPIGLQCYGNPGDARLHLERSAKKWRTFYQPRKE